EDCSWPGKSACVSASCLVVFCAGSRNTYMGLFCMDVALTGTPLSNAFRSRFELASGSAPTYLFIAELRRLPLMKLLQRFLCLHATRLFIPLEDESSRTFIPLFYCLATFGRAREIVVVHPDLACERISRWRTSLSLAGIVRASFDGQMQKHIFQ